MPKAILIIDVLNNTREDSMMTKAEVKQTRKEVAMKTGITEVKEEVKKGMMETEGNMTAKITKIMETFKEEVTTMEQGTKRTKGAQSKGSEQTRGTRGKAQSRTVEALASTEAEEAMRAWDVTVATMTQLDTPATVARAAAAAIHLTAKVWNFQAADAVEEVTMKAESRSPLTFSPWTLGKPQRGISLRVIADSLMKHQVGGEITMAIWNAIKKARTAQSGPSSYTTEVTGKFGSLYEAMEAWKIHYENRDHCELRTRTMAETIRGTSLEVEELRKEVLRAHREGLAATKLAVMDEAGDVWYGAQCYMVAYQEQRQRAIVTWLGQAKPAMIVKQWRWRSITMTKPDEETRSRSLGKIETLYQTIRDRGMGADYFEKAMVRNMIRACLEGTSVSIEHALIASWLKTNERTLALHADEKISRAQADFAWERAKRGTLKSMVHLVHTKVSGGAERAEEEIVQARLNRIERGDPKMAEVSKPDIARAALPVELKELGEAFKSGNIGDICDEAGDVLHCSIYLHAATVEQEEKNKAAKQTTTTNSRVHRLLIFDTCGLFFDSMGIFAHGAMSMIRVHSRCRDKSSTCLLSTRPSSTR